MRRQKKIYQKPTLIFNNVDSSEYSRLKALLDAAATADKNGETQESGAAIQNTADISC